MGVCIEERPVMHWQQCARFLGPGVKEKSPTPPVAHLRTSNCVSAAGANTNPLYRSCSSCSDFCDQSTKPTDASFVDSFNSFEAGSVKYSSRIDCTEINEETNSRVSFKSEPFGPPSSPDSTCEAKIIRNCEDCAACGLSIQDRFYLSTIGKRWHVNCLRCFACRQPLDRESSCYSRDGNIFCKNDYFSFFGTRHCSGCGANINSTELVMRAPNLVFHVRCFYCAECKTPLTKGDQYGIIDRSIYCRTHYNIARDNDVISSTRLNVNSITFSSQFCSSQKDSSSPSSDRNRIVPSGMFMPASHVISGLPQPPRQKGRPRKRKPKDIEAFTSNIDLNAEYLDFGRGSHMNSSRTKRMRTSFKHHQLRTMKSYFAINHNPDAKDLKQLSQKTGLPKRVLQVWFQNARAKWRRMMMKQDGSNILEKGDRSLDLDSISTHSPNSFIMSGSNNTPPPHSLD